MSKFYLAGPMTGYPKFNYPAFHAAAADLRSKGFEIISPAEQDPQATQDQAMASVDGALGCTDETWGDMLARDVKLIADNVDGIIFLPGWQRSKGARLEAYVGVLCGREFYAYTTDIGPEQITTTEVMHEICNATR